MSLLITQDRVVSIHYTLTNNRGEILDSSEGDDPLIYLQGAGNIIPGLENALVGKKQGDSLRVTVAPEEAYGVRQAELMQDVPRAMFAGVSQLEVGMAFQAQGMHGEMQRVVIASIKGDTITVDANHPLAGETLTFAVTIEAVREASAEELAHGHVHGVGGHHHD